MLADTYLRLGGFNIITNYPLKNVKCSQFIQVSPYQIDYFPLLLDSSIPNMHIKTRVKKVCFSLSKFRLAFGLAGLAGLLEDAVGSDRL